MKNILFILAVVGLCFGWIALVYTAAFANITAFIISFVVSVLSVLTICYLVKDED